MVKSDLLISKLSDQVMELKRELEYVKGDVLELTAICESLKTEVVELEGRMMCLKDQLEEVDREQNTIQKNQQKLEIDITTIQKNQQKLEISFTTLQRDVEDLKSIIPSDDDLILGELCHRVQSMIFQKILPPDWYDDRESYEISNNMDKYLRLFFYDDDDDDDEKHEHKINVANQAWTELQKKLKWQETDVERMVRGMERIPKRTILAAHPELTEVILRESTKRMNDAGKLSSCTHVFALWLIDVWKQLKMMA